MTTGFVWHERYMWHEIAPAAGVFLARGFIQPGQHFENSETKRRFKNLLDVSGFSDSLTMIKLRLATREELLRVHTVGYVDRVQALSDADGGDAGEYALLDHGGYDIAALSAGGVIAAVEAVVAGQVDNAYALVRPPGHHAEADLGRGFCIFANGAIAARHAQAALGIGKVAILDWDVHHGNGAEKIFYDDPSVLTVSLHQDGNFPPGSGPVEDTGSGAGAGFNLNLPLPAGCGHDAYMAAIDVALAVLEGYAPDLILVSCGFDAGAMDPLGRMSLHSGSFRAMTERVKALAERVCGGRLVLLHEGGYSAPTVPFFGVAVIEALSGLDSGVGDPFLPILMADPVQAITGDQRAAIDRIKAMAKRVGLLA